MIYGIMQLSRKIKVEHFFGGVNRQQKRAEFFAALNAADATAASLVDEPAETAK
jgi:NADH-quinone oxidoreductase subunit B